MELRYGLPGVAAVRALGPGVALSLVVSLDGQLCGPDGSSRSISGDEDLHWLRTLRAASDRVVVGARTAERERYTAIRCSGEYLAQRQDLGVTHDPELVVVRRTDNLAMLLRPGIDHCLLEAGVALHEAAASYIDRVWISHSPTVTGNVGAAFSLPLTAFRLAARYVGEQYVVSQFERVSPR